MRMAVNPESTRQTAWAKCPEEQEYFLRPKASEKNFLQQADSADASLPSFLAGRLQKKNSISPVSFDLWTGGVR